MSASRREAKELHRARIAEAVEVGRNGDVGEILRLLDSPDPAVRRYVVSKARRRELVEAIPELARRALGEPDPGVRTSMTLAIAEAHDPRYLETLWALTREDPNMRKYDFPDYGWNDVRRLALRGLSFLGDPDALDLALALYAEGGIFNKQEALEALARLSTLESRAALGDLLTRARSPYWRRRIRQAIRQSGKLEYASRDR